MSQFFFFVQPMHQLAASHSKHLENTFLCHIIQHALLGSHFLPLIFQIQKETKENLGIG